MSKLIVSPSILSADFSDLAGEIKNLNDTECEWIHFDVMDGHFVNNLTFGAPLIKSVRALSTKIFDVHLMMENPLKYLDDFVDAGSDYISIHLECEDVKQMGAIHCLEMIKKKGVKAGLVIQPDTNVAEIISYLPYCDLVLVMSVYAGFGGQSFIESSLNKISLLNEIISSLTNEVLISVDGGINNKTVHDVKQSGANIIISGSYIFKGNYNERIKNLK
ncbi:MAG: ribulose-phosphate 3-epimerase [Bacilli bacterium]